MDQVKTLTVLLFCNFFCFAVLQQTEETGTQPPGHTSTQEITNTTSMAPVIKNTSIQTQSESSRNVTQVMTTRAAEIIRVKSTIGTTPTSLQPGNVSADGTQNKTVQEETITPVEPAKNTTETVHKHANVTDTTDINSLTSVQTDSLTSTVIVPALDKKWMDFFQRIHHFDGLYEYEGGRYSFDFVIMYVHPIDDHTLVAKFYDQDGAIIEMNGTSTDGHHIIFRQSNTYSADFRFSALSHFELDGMLVTSGGSSYYSGNVTRPLNSSFTWFHMNKGLGSIVTGDAESTRTAIIIVIPASLAFLAVIGTSATLCWASKKGLFGRRHKSYLLFTDNPVSYESEAETIHI